MKKEILILILVIYSMSVFSQHVGIKNNLVYDATLTPNIGFEIGLSKKSTLDLNVGYNPFTFSDHKKFKHWLVQPEYRLWLCEKFNGTFFGIHAHGGEFSVSGKHLPFGIFPNLEGYRYEGHFYGGGVSIGYQWILGKHWNLEISAGAGYTLLDYDKYNCPDCGPKLDSGQHNYWGPTKASISFIYLIH
ncbi:DUF3575 domain-containing protein [Dysgonomonas sp. Marseille-P4677]|uniref:DUF3575 domain-containing protein n=1 Tax=Dysgonomonas sp. Marseille-P4677 TaxID=2364790 RepID=UPI00191410A0|nr:DUF3575 domain-containing protein [Dysgonomonas sp. Marseille-P4677]MBK5722260.1 DUF3575 domain-containing protein [Dysgonomonas sp. Marseille-P4677]